MTSITVCSRVNTTQNTAQVQSAAECHSPFIAVLVYRSSARIGFSHIHWHLDTNATVWAQTLSVQTLTKQSGLLCCSAQSSTSSVMAKGCGCALLGSAWKISPSSNWACAKPPVTPAIRSQPATRGPRHSNGVTPEKQPMTDANGAFEV